MARYGMVIDLQKCTGCGACGVGCKTENNTDDRADGQTFNWADFIVKIDGKFPNVVATTIPVLCNHCTDAPCVEACPVEPKAMFKQENGVTMHNDERCIGCRLCQEACPYSAMDVDKEKAEYSVISFNDFGHKAHAAFADNTEAIQGGTASGAEIAAKAGAKPPYQTKYKHPEYASVRRDGISEKCILCDHRLANKQQPYCTVVCPSGSRVVGDFDDPNSEVSRLVKMYKGKRLKNNQGEFLGENEKGVQPNVYYIRSFSQRKG